MLERQQIQFNESLPKILSEIRRPHQEEVTLFDFKDALAVDDKMVVAYKHFWVPGKGEGDKILIARERVTPIKAEIHGRETIYPYPNQEELRGIYGILIFPISIDRPVLYVGEQYKVTFEGSFYKNGKRSADVTIESTCPIRADFIDGRADYNHYLWLANSGFNKG